MNYLFQFALIAVITFIGEILNYLIPLPIPASIYGLIILLAALCTKLVKLKHVEKAADFFLTIMPVMFVPPTVGLMTKWPVLKDNLFGLLVTCILSTVIVMAVTGFAAEKLLKYSKKAAAQNSLPIPSEDLKEAEKASGAMLYPEGADNDASDDLFSDNKTKGDDK